ncbi:hypothetical protein SAMN06298211_101501 [Prevotellaceae bacterium MN60]|nr:hypothetical protein SAMN06298211_101501 [Prevotellaceae bacterium MN60]
MKKTLLLFSLLLMVCGIAAQSIGQIDEKKMMEYRETIGLDYSMPDFNTSKIDAKVIGVRLAKILQSLEENYVQGYYNRTLASILAEQLETPAYQFVAVTKIKTQQITKMGDEITILLKTTFKSTNEGKKNTILTLRFFQGISDSHFVNSLFYALGNYLKEDENY